MRVEHVEIEHFSGSVTGAQSASSSWASRSGMILTAVTPDGCVGQGEASPLPGYSTDDYDAAVQTLNAIDWRALPEPDPPRNRAELLDRLRQVGDHAPLPSARFALETAYLDLVGQRALLPIWAMLGNADPAPRTAPLSSLVGSADDPDVVELAKAASARGVASVKVKVSGPLTSARVAQILAVRAAIGGTALRLDANGTLASGELASVREANIEFIEEPVPKEQLPELADSGVPIALDESLQVSEHWGRLEPHLARLRCVALVLKPMALGGFSACLEWSRRAEAAGIETTISHLFDGPIALTASAHLAIAIGSRRYGSGLDAHGALRAWPEMPLPLHGGAAIVAGGAPGLGLHRTVRGPS